MQNVLRVDAYKSGRIVIFVHGYAINQNECEWATADELARKLGLSSYPVRDFMATVPCSYTVTV